MSERFPIVQEPRHVMLPPEPGQYRGPALCGAGGGVLVLMHRNADCPNCLARMAAEATS